MHSLPVAKLRGNPLMHASMHCRAAGRATGWRCAPTTDRVNEKPVVRAASPPVAFLARQKMLNPRPPARRSEFVCSRSPPIFDLEAEFTPNGKPLNEDAARGTSRQIECTRPPERIRLRECHLTPASEDPNPVRATRFSCRAPLQSPARRQHCGYARQAWWQRHAPRSRRRQRRYSRSRPGAKPLRSPPARDWQSGSAAGRQ